MIKDALKGISLNIIILGFVSLFTDLSSQMVFPLLPLFLTTVLHANATIVGLVEGAAETTASLLKVFSGYWSDKIRRRKPFVLLGYSISAAMKPLFSISYIWESVVFIRIIERIGKGIRNAPRDALVAESSTIENRGKAYGIQRSMDGLGSILGAITAFLLLPLYGFRNIFLLSALPAFLAVIIILSVKEKKVKQSYSKKTLKISFKALPKKLKIFILISIIFTMGNVGYAFLLLKAVNLGFDNSMTISLYVLFYIIYTILSIPFGVISDKIGRKPILLSGYLLYTLICLSLIVVSSLPGLILIFIVYGIFFALTDGVQRAFVVDLSPKELKGTSLGTFHTSIGLTALPAGLLAGSLWTYISPNATFLFGLITSIITSMIFILLYIPGRDTRF